MESPRQNQLPVTPQLTVVQGDGGKGFSLKGVARLFDERTVATLVPMGVDISFTDLCSEIIRLVNLHQPRMPGRHLMASDIALSSSSDHQRVDCHFRVEDGPLPEPPISGYLASRGLKAYPDTKLICDPRGNVVSAVSRTEELNKRQVRPPLGLVMVNSITHAADTATCCPCGTFEIDIEVQTASGLRPMRATVALRPGGRVSFFSAPGKEHWGTVAPDGKTLIDIDPPLDTNFVATTTIGAMPPGDMPVFRGFDPDTGMIKIG